MSCLRNDLYKLLVILLHPFRVYKYVIFYGVVYVLKLHAAVITI